MFNTYAAAGGTPATEPPVRRDAQIRPAQVGDVKVLHQFVVELTETEQFPGEVTAESGDLERALFGEDAVAEAVVATIGAEPVGFALYYSSYSTILGRPGLHLEDLYVRPSIAVQGWARLCSHTWPARRSTGGAAGWNGGCFAPTTQPCASTGDCTPEASTK